MSHTCGNSTPTNQSRRRFLQKSSATLAALALTPSGLFAANGPGQPAIVTTPSGKLRGETVTAVGSGPAVRVFRGVPFAEPPIGPLRFRPTVPVKPWKGVREATTFGAAAIQPGNPALTQSEDCLYLNIWAPSGNGTGNGPYPVYVWIHGGAYIGGDSFAPIFDGTEFARNGIVLVTVAYRLGVFGFMNLEPLLGPSYSDSANNALRDLIASLEWVHHNIAAFGGDPARVTIGGESSGAKATAALMAIPQAARLFRSAISESGGGERVLTLAEAAEVAHAYGALWRSNHPVSANAFDDLLTAPPATLMATQARLIATFSRHFPFRSEIGHSFLPKRPVDLIATGSSAGRRLLIGTNRDESASFIGPHPHLDPTNRDLGNLDLSTFNKVFARYKSIYPNLSDEQLRIRAVSAEEYWVPSVRLAEAHTHSGGSTWMYRLDYAKPSGPMVSEAYHALDLSLVWQKLDAIEQADPNAAPLSNAMHQAWVAFIQGNTPAAPTLPTWPKFDLNTRATMIFAPHPHVEERPQEAELQLWNGLL
jgi:para-nitrobenzyl esterase